MSWDDTLKRMLPPIGGVPSHITGPAGRFGAGKAAGRNPPSSIPHKGVDANYFGGQNALNKSHPILHAPVDGEVVLSGGRSGTISIKDSNGFVHKLMHTSTRNVEVGDRVSAGDAIGRMGNTGTHDFHLHYQLEDGTGRQVDPVEFWNRQGPVDPDPLSPAFLDQSKRASEIMSGGIPTSAPSISSPDTPAQPLFSPFGKSVSDPNPFADRFGKWGSVPLPNALAASDGPANFADRFGNWDLRAPGALGNVGAPPPQVTPNLGKRAETDDTPVRVLSRRADLSPPSGDVPTPVPEASPPLLGLVSGKPMPDWPVQLSIFQSKDQASPEDNELFQRWMRWVKA